MTLPQFAMRLLFAVVLGTSIGLERQWRQRLAGLRTNALVAGGACLFATLQTLVGPNNTDPTRIAAQIVSGIGFLGAGVIMREGLNVRGLNTAATLWCTAAVGTLTGCGFIAEAMIGAAVILAANVVLRPLAQKINHQPAAEATEVETQYRVKLICREKDENRVRFLLLNAVNQESLMIRALHSEDTSDSKKIEVTALIVTQGSMNSALEKVVGRLSMEDSVSTVRWEIVPDHLSFETEARPSTGGTDTLAI